MYYLAPEPVREPLRVVGIGLAQARQLGREFVIAFLGRLDRFDPSVGLQEWQAAGMSPPAFRPLLIVGPISSASRPISRATRAIGSISDSFKMS